MHSKICFTILAITIALVKTGLAALATFKYHNYVELTKFLQQLATKYPTKTHLYSIGRSVQGRELWVMAIADTNPHKHITLRPEAKYIGNMHGNEVPSKEVLIHLLDYMLENQAADADVNYIMRNTRLHVMPSMNPDGFEVSVESDCSSVTGRANAHDYDLNRNFADLFEPNNVPTQPETKAVMDWLAENDFVLSANAHGGSVVVSYPFDNYINSQDKAKPSLSDDHDVFVAMATNYSRNNPAMMEEQKCTAEEPSFVNGTTNGAAWYPVRGGMQDYNYWKVGCMEVTIEMSCCKYPDRSELESIWNENKQSLIEYLKFANRGVRGVVKFADGSVGKHLTIKIDSREPAFKTNANGEFYRILLPGQYLLSILIGCDKVVSATSVRVPASKGLLEYNITINGSYLSDYKSATLNRYATFCAKPIPRHAMLANLENTRQPSISILVYFVIGVLLIYRVFKI